MRDDDSEDVIATLAFRASAELLQHDPTLAKDKTIRRTMIVLKAMDLQETFAGKLRQAILNDPSFGDLREGWLQYGGGGQLIQKHVLPHFLITHVIDGGQSTLPKVLESLRALAQRGTDVAEVQAAAAGATISGPVLLAGDIQIVPWQDLPESSQKQIFGSDEVAIAPFSALRAKPTIALRGGMQEVKILFRDSGEGSTQLQRDMENYGGKVQALSDVTRCLTALTVAPVSILGQWSFLEIMSANSLIGVGYSYGEDVFNPKLGAFRTVVEASAISSIFSSFLQLKVSDRDVIRIALDRLNQALRKRSQVDTAIDLGIAIEAMLLHGMPDDDRGELTYRQAVRGAIFLGGSKADRKANFDLLRDAYSLRSKAVHTGRLTTGKRGRTPEQILDDTARVCAALARKIIERGSFPENWEAEYVLGDDEKAAASS